MCEGIFGSGVVDIEGFFPELGDPNSDSVSGGKVRVTDKSLLSRDGEIELEELIEKQPEFLKGMISRNRE